MKKGRKLRSWKHKGDWPIIREVRKGDRIKFKVDTTSRLGRREQKIRDTRDEAEILCEQYRVRLKNEGIHGFELDASEQKDAKQAMGIAAALGFSSLTEALQKLEVYHKPAGGECSVVKFRDEFLKHYTKQHDDGVFSSRTLSSYRSKTDPLRKQFGTMQIRELNGPAVWTELKRLSRTRGWGRGTLASYVSVWQVFFSYAQKTERIVESPLSGGRISFEIAQATKLGALQPPAILSVSDASILLRAAWEMRDRGLLQAIVVLLFGGLRPNAEMLKLEWDDIEMDEGILNVGGDRSKNEVSARSVNLCDAATQWLELCPEGRFTPRNWKRNWEALRKATGLFSGWVEDTTRHSFASYSFGLHRDPERLRRELGHVDHRMFSHYLQVSSAVRRNAQKYFALSPAMVLPPSDEG